MNNETGTITIISSEPHTETATNKIKEIVNDLANNGASILLYEFSSEQYSKTLKANEDKLKGINIHLGKSLYVEDIINDIREYKKKNDIKYVIIDGLEVIQTQEKYCLGRADIVSIIYNQLKQLAQDLKLSIIATEPSGTIKMKERIINYYIREKLYKINELATQFYQDKLAKSKGAREYLKQRYIYAETIKSFRLGYAPSGTELYNYLIEQGYTEQEIIYTDLCTKSEDGKYADKFENRLIFPIINAENDIVGFGARVLNDDKPKYINTADNDIFTKSKNLYGLNIAKDYAKDGIIIVEGYIDLIALQQAGIENVVAILGTEFTNEQIKLINEYTNTVCT